MVSYGQKVLISPLAGSSGRAINGEIVDGAAGEPMMMGLVNLLKNESVRPWRFVRGEPRRPPHYRMDRMLLRPSTAPSPIRVSVAHGLRSTVPHVLKHTTANENRRIVLLEASQRYRSI